VSGDLNFQLVEADLRNLSALRERLTGYYEVIVHLAAKAGVRPSLQDPLAYQEVNVGGTQNLLELAKEWGVRSSSLRHRAAFMGRTRAYPGARMTMCCCP
jgi:nucleoside-diphosphate-sugar epimerase